MSFRWMDDALCRTEGIPTDVFYPPSDVGLGLAKSFCARCPVRRECLDHAVDHHEDDGVWGGHSERSRVRIRQRRNAGGTS